MSELTEESIWAIYKRGFEGAGWRIDMWEDAWLEDALELLHTYQKAGECLPSPNSIKSTCDKSGCIKQEDDLLYTNQIPSDGKGDASTRKDEVAGNAGFVTSPTPPDAVALAAVAWKKARDVCCKEVNDANITALGFAESALNTAATAFLEKNGGERG